MKTSKICMALAASMLTVLLGGCGDEPYSLTESEEKIIVGYSAHVVSKYNNYQADGLTWVDFETEKETENPPEEVPSEDEEASEEQTGSPQGGGTDSQEAVATHTATLNELFGMQGISIEYTGAYLANNYVQDSYYAMYPDTGKQYLVLQIDVANTAGVDVEVDNLVLASTFRAAVGGETEAVAEITILLEDFAQLREVIPADTVRETVLLFQVPDSLTEIGSLDLYVTMGGEKYQIIL